MNAREQNLLKSVTVTTWRFRIWVGFLLAVLAVGAYAYVLQLRQGLVVTGLRDQVSWGLYITNFVFFIGISHAGTLISAILRVTDTEWRRPITRMAEAITVFALCIGGPMVIVDLGRPDRMWNLFRYGRIQSPIIWDVLSVSTYLVGCLLYFFIPMIPDLALLADRHELAPWRRRLYKRLSLGWTGTPGEKELLERAIGVMAVVIIPLAVSVHTVVSWIFAMTLRPGWDSSIFGPYFVIGAIYSGAAGVVFSMFVLRRIYRLEAYIEIKHFRNLGLLLLSFALLYLYFNINEYLTIGYKVEGPERRLVYDLFFGRYAGAFWTVQTVGVIVPLLLMLTVLAWPRYRQFTVQGVSLAAFLVVIGAWAKRYLIIVPTLQTPFLPAQHLPENWTNYTPTWVEWSITAAALAGFLLIYTLLSKLFPIVSIWETRAEGEPTSEVSVAGASRWWRRGTAANTTALVLLAALLVFPSRAQAKAPRKLPPQPTVITIESHVVPTPASEPTGEAAPSQPDSHRVYFYAGPWLNHPPPFGGQEEKTEPPAIAVVASLRNPDGTPAAYKAVTFALQTGFGVLQLGSRPTDARGHVELVLRDQRYGAYPITVSFSGDDEFAPATSRQKVEFGLPPAPGLPRTGVLITPYATPGIGIPFLGFYGFMWVVFTYTFGYLVLYRMRRVRQENGNRTKGGD
ncbi:MAG: polysulfide reductase NrfD [Candidatus Koribacter versatilis]|uniref:Polysulfide reductase NrfD n=1 Tax=Candidatus Korobacter versatilis TaxID=658062 RepID=A0A932A965_9BACT|nr:polysulfide reductase NrfD [Candidatus Koribacter versatilis]